MELLKTIINSNWFCTITGAVIGGVLTIISIWLDSYRREKKDKDHANKLLIGLCRNTEKYINQCLYDSNERVIKPYYDQCVIYTSQQDTWSNINRWCKQDDVFLFEEIRFNLIKVAFSPQKGDVIFGNELIRKIEKFNKDQQ